jgi:hypothetical protein
MVRCIWCGSWRRQHRTPCRSCCRRWLTLCGTATTHMRATCRQAMTPVLLSVPSRRRLTHVVWTTVSLQAWVPRGLLGGTTLTLILL